MTESVLNVALAAETIKKPSTEPIEKSWVEVPEDRREDVPPEDVRRYVASLWASQIGHWDNGETSRAGAGSSMLAQMLIGPEQRTTEARKKFEDAVTYYSGLGRSQKTSSGDWVSYNGFELDSDYHGDPVLREAANVIGLSDMAIPCKSHTSCRNWADDGNNRVDRWVVHVSFGYRAPRVHHYLLKDGRVLMSTHDAPWKWIDALLERNELLPGMEFRTRTWR